MSQVIVNPISTTILHIRSKDADQIVEGLNSNFTVQLASAIEVNQDEEIHCQLISAEIPHSMYCISEAVKNNTIVYDTNQTFTFPSQNYDIYELLSVINSDASFPLTATHNAYTNKLTFTNNTETGHTINWTSSLANKLLGFGEAPDQVVNDGGGTTTSPGMVDLATIHSIFIKSDLASGNVLSTRAGNSTTLQKISIDVNPYNIIYLNQQDYRTVSVIQNQAVDRVSFKLTDQNDNLLDFNDINYEFSLQFMIYPKQRRLSRRTIQGIPIPNPQPIPQPQTQPQLISAPNPQPMVRSNDQVLLETEDHDDSHPIEDKTAIEYTAEKTILDHIIDKL